MLITQFSQTFEITWIWFNDTNILQDGFEYQCGNVMIDQGLFYSG